MENQDTHPVPMIKSGVSENDMQAFYASLISETTSLPTPTSLKNTNLSEKTKTSIHTLGHLLSKDFSLLLHPECSIEMKDTLKYLLTLHQNQGFSMTTEIEIQKLLSCFEMWSLEYCNASKLSATAEAELSKTNEVKNALENNARSFRIMDGVEKFKSHRLVGLQEKKRELEEKIKIINVEIKNYTISIDMKQKEKTYLFQEGRKLKADLDDMRIHVTKLKAEQELAQRTQAIIEKEWSKLGEEFIQNTGFNDWV